MKTLIAGLAFIMLICAHPASAQESAFVRELNLEESRAKDFHRHEAAAEKYDSEREAHVDVYKEKVAHQEERQEEARKAYVEAQRHRQKGISEEEIDELLQKDMERRAARYEAEREAYVRLRDQVEKAHRQAPLNENEEYGL